MALASALGLTTGSTIVDSLAAMATPFKSNSTSVKSSVKGVKEIQKVVKDEVSSPLIGMSKFFASIDEGIRNVAKSTADSLGITKIMSMIMAKDLTIQEKQDQEAKAKKRDAKIKSGETIDETTNKSGKTFVQSIKDAAADFDFGDKLKAALLLGGFYIFMQLKESIIPVIKALIKGFIFVRDKVFGNTKNPTANTMLAFLGILTAISFIGPIKIAKFVAIKVGLLATQLGAFLLNTTFVAGTFSKMSMLMKTSLIPAVLGMLTSIGTMALSLGAMLVPFSPILGAIAIGVAVLYSLKKGFDVFRESLEDGDSMLVAIIKGVQHSLLTLISLPVILFKKLVSFVAGLLGFDNFKEKLEKIDVAKMLGDSLILLVTSAFKFIKALTLGVIGALKALLPGGEGPIEAFKRVYSEVMSGGKGETRAVGSDGETIDTPESEQEKQAEKKVRKEAAKYNYVNFLLPQTKLADILLEGMKKAFASGSKAQTEGSLADGFKNSNAPLDAFNDFDFDLDTNNVIPMKEKQKKLDAEIKKQEELTKGGSPFIISQNNMNNDSSNKSYSTTSVVTDVSASHSDLTARHLSEAVTT
jgi:hypothetical protein